MQLARVRGNVVASIKAGGLAALKLLLLEPASAASPLPSDSPSDSAPDSAPDAQRQRTPTEVYVAIDLVGAGVGEIVLVTLGSAARVAADGHAAPTDAAVIAIVDSVQLDGRTTFIKR